MSRETYKKRNPAKGLGLLQGSYLLPIMAKILISPCISQSRLRCKYRIKYNTKQIGRKGEKWSIVEYAIYTYSS